MGLMLKENRLKVNYYFYGQVKRLINKPVSKSQVSKSQIKEGNIIPILDP